MTMYWLDKILSIFLFRLKKQKKLVNRIGFIRLAGGIGDWITLLPSVDLLREKFSKNHYSIYAIVDEQWSSLIKLNPNIDVVIPVNRKKYGSSIFYRFKVNYLICELALDTIFDFALFRRLSIGDSIVRASGAKNCIGFFPQLDQPRELKFGNSLFTKLVDDAKWEEHEISRNLRLVFSCHGDDRSADLTPRMNFGESVKIQRFVCAPGASVSARIWDPQNFASLAHHIYALTGWQPVLIGSKADHAAISAVKIHSASLPWEVYDGSLDILDFVKFVSTSNLLICNESGPMHIGPAVQTSTIAIVSGAEFSAYSRYPAFNEFLRVVHSDTACFNCRWNCKYDWDNRTQAPCLKAVKISEAIAAIDELLLSNWGITAMDKQSIQPKISINPPT